MDTLSDVRYAAWDRHFAQRAQRMRASDIREAFKLTEDPSVISFAGGFPSPDTFPVEALAHEIGAVLREDARTALQYGPTEGLYLLRAWIAERLRGQGIAAAPEEVLITHGSQQGLDLLAKIFIDPGDLVVVESPTYVSGIGAMAAYEAQIHGIPVDEEGLRTDLLEAFLRERRRRGLPGPKLLYTIPNFQNPSGVTLSLERRRHLVRLAGEFDFFICEDDPYGELRLEGEPLPPLKALDEEGRVFYLGSFSKIFLPGLRLGWIAAPQPVIGKLTVARQATDLCQNTFGQKLVLQCAAEGLIDGRLDELRQVYRVRRDAMLSALQRHFPEEAQWTRPKGGFFVWASLPDGIDTKALLPAAIAEERVAYVAGTAFYADGRQSSAMRLAYSQVSPEQIEEGIARLGRFFRRRLGAGGAEAVRPAWAPASSPARTVAQ